MKHTFLRTLCSIEMHFAADRKQLVTSKATLFALVKDWQFSLRLHWLICRLHCFVSELRIRISGLTLKQWSPNIPLTVIEVKGHHCLRISIVAFSFLPVITCVPRASRNFLLLVMDNFSFWGGTSTYANDIVLWIIAFKQENPTNCGTKAADVLENFFLA